MTEDDTFRALSRPGLWEMKRLYREWMCNIPHGTNEDRRAMFNSHGWGVQEFVLELRKRNIKLPHD